MSPSTLELSTSAGTNGSSRSRTTPILCLVWVLLAAGLAFGAVRGASIQGELAVVALALLMTTAFLGSQLYAHLAKPASTASLSGEASDLPRSV